MADETLLQKLVDLDIERRTLEARVEAIQKERARIEEQLLEEWQQNGISSVRVNGMTVYLKRELWAGATDGDIVRACAALEQAGLDEFVKETFSVQTLSAYVREKDKEGEPLPSSFEGTITVTEKYKIQTRRT